MRSSVLVGSVFLWAGVVGAATARAPAAWATTLPTPSWGPCPFNASASTVCANVTVPANWNDPLSPSVFVHVSLARVAAPVGTVWFLNGGSGVASECLAGSSIVAFLNSLGFDVGLPDFRGTGLSWPNLYCPGDPQGYNVPTIACAAYLNATLGTAGMYNFSITMASHDLAFLIQSLSRTGSANFIQTDSFGSFWGQRFLEIYPAMLAGAVIESFGVPNRWNYFEAADNIDWAVRRTLQYCSLNETCGAYLGAGADPYALASLVRTMAANNTLPCNARLPSSMGPDFDTVFRNMLAALGGSGSRDTFAFIPALVYRWARCNADDVAALTYFFENVMSQSDAFVFPHQKRSLLGSPTDADACDISEVVLYNLFFAEGVLRAPPTTSDFVAHWDTLLAAVPLSVLLPQLDTYRVWPKYPLDEWAHAYPQTTTPMLLMVGDLDISTPYDNAIYSRISGYTKASQHFVHLPMAPHVGFLQSPQYGSPIPCGAAIIGAFFQANGTSVDTSCIANMIPLDFLGATPNPMIQAYFGTADLWQYDGPQPLWYP